MSYTHIIKNRAPMTQNASTTGVRSDRWIPISERKDRKTLQVDTNAQNVEIQHIFKVQRNRLWLLKAYSMIMHETYI